MSFSKNIGKNIGINISKSLNSKYSQKILDHAKKSATDALKLLQKESFKKQREQPVIYLEITLLIKLQEHQRLLQKIIQERMKKEHLEKNIYHQN